jgi:hypothetical protein
MECKTFSIWTFLRYVSVNHGSFLGAIGYGGAHRDSSLATGRDSGFAGRTYPSHSRARTPQNSLAF